MALSLIWLVYVSSRPNIAELGRKVGADGFVDVADDPAAETEADLAIVRFDGGLWFVNSGTLGDHLREIRVRSAGELKGVILCMEGVDYIDAEGADALKEDRPGGSRPRASNLHLARVKASRHGRPEAGSGRRR